MPITSVRFKNFKALRNCSVSLQRMNVLVGPNNSGKSTILSAFRVLEQALRRARSRSASRVMTHTGRMSWGHKIPVTTVPISLENVHSDYADADSSIEVRYSHGNKIYLFFPADGGVTMYWETTHKLPTTPSAFWKTFPDIVQTIPVLGPVEQDELIVTDDTVRRAAGTPVASRHFRNYWWKNPEGFERFQRLVESTWSGMSIRKPEKPEVLDKRLTMFVTENRIPRELYWSGLGFQVWCQLLTHISRCSASDMLIVDEPEVYLHPEVQRQLLGILREVRPDIVLATHSVEILGEADPSEIVLVDKSRQLARRLHNVEGVQRALENIGSVQNLTLTELARNRRILFVEGLHDYKIIRRFAGVLGVSALAAGSGLTPFESGGFDAWSRIQALAWGFKNTLKAELSIGAIFDRDYRCEEELTQLRRELENEINFAHFHGRKEIENYLLSPAILDRATKKAVKERERRTGESRSADIDVMGALQSITDGLKAEYSGQYIDKYCKYFKSSGRDQATLATDALNIFESKWSGIDSRMEVVAGKAVLRALRERLQESHGITLTDWRIVDCYRMDEIPEDLVALLRRLEEFRNASGG